MGVRRSMEWMLSPAGRVGLLSYLLAGTCLFGLKYGVDTVIAAAMGQRWSLFYYWPGTQ